MGEKFRFGIIGAGVISAYHAKAIQAHPDGEIVAVADIVKPSLDKFVAEYGGEGMTDLDAMLRRPDIDAVCVCSPTFLHAQHAIAAMNAGKHVIVEKSMAINLKDATKMITTAREKNVKLAVIFQKRTEEAPQRIKKAIADGVFGKMVFGDASIKYWRNQAYYDSADWRGTWAKEGGGASMTQGTHGIDLLLYMMGDVEKIYAWMDTVAHYPDRGRGHRPRPAQVQERSLRAPPDRDRDQPRPGQRIRVQRDMRHGGPRRGHDHELGGLGFQGNARQGNPRRV